MAWVITITIDPDKNDVGVIDARFTDTDASVFIYDDKTGNRIRATLAQINTYRDAAIAARNAWQARKTAQTGYMATAVARFAASGETATAGASL